MYPSAFLIRSYVHGKETNSKAGSAAFMVQEPVYKIRFVLLCCSHEKRTLRKVMFFLCIKKINDKSASLISIISHMISKL